MKFTPHGIKSQEFGASMRGYDKDEVAAFLENLSDEFEKLIYENEQLKEEVESLREEVSEYKKIEKNLQETLLKANESSSKALDSTKRQTSLMLKEAELKAAQIVNEAEEKAAFIKEAVMKLREEKQLLIAKLKAMVDTQSKLLAFDVENIETEPARREIEIAKPQNIQTKNEKINVNDILEKLL
ncbi:MAG: DivIVA domain-containing protein [Chlorobi bacterium]|nr:DivIVA domain-containing protein [Chlorobiota bacterium]